MLLPAGVKEKKKRISHDTARTCDEALEITDDVAAIRTSAAENGSEDVQETREEQEEARTQVPEDEDRRVSEVDKLSPPAINVSYTNRFYCCI